MELKSKINQTLKMEIFQKLDLNSIRKKLKEMVEKYKEIELFALLDQNGVTMMDLVSDKLNTADTTGLDKKHRSWFNEIITGKDYYISDPYFSSVTEEPCITLSLPVKKDGEIIAVLAVDIQINNGRLDN